MVVVHLIFSFNIGGAEAMLVDILRHQSKVCTTHLVIVNDAIDLGLLKTLSSRTKIHQIGRKPGSRTPWPLLRLNLLLRQIGADVVHMHNANAAALFPKWFDGPWRKVVTIHGLGKSCVNLDRYDIVFAISSAVKLDLAERCGYNSAVVPNGINFDEIISKKETQQMNKPWNIVQVSRLLHEKKGQHLLIDALAILRNRYHIDATVTFIGEGPSLEFLQLKVRKLGIEKYCTFAGLWNRERVYQKLNEFDLLVQPSSYEGFGLTVVEGIAARLPVIASDAGGPAEILKDGQYGWLFRKGDCQDLADKLRTVIELMQVGDTDTKLHAAYSYGKANFDISRTADKYMQEYLC